MFICSYMYENSSCSWDSYSTQLHLVLKVSLLTTQTHYSPTHSSRSHYTIRHLNKNVSILRDTTGMLCTNSKPREKNTHTHIYLSHVLLCCEYKFMIHDPSRQFFKQTAIGMNVYSLQQWREFWTKSQTVGARKCDNWLIKFLIRN